jgi:hypothetical protein
MAAADIVAFMHDFGDYAGAVASDLRAVEVIGAAPHSAPQMIKDPTAGTNDQALHLLLHEVRGLRGLMLV